MLITPKNHKWHDVKHTLTWNIKEAKLNLQQEYIKYLKQNISKSQLEISRSFRRNSVALCKNGDLVVSIIRVCFLIVDGNGSDES